MKNKFAQMYSIRCKIKDATTAEVVVMTSDTNAISLLKWNFVANPIKVKMRKFGNHDINLSAKFTDDGNVIVTVTDLDMDQGGYIVWNPVLNKKLGEEKIKYDFESITVSEESD